MTLSLAVSNANVLSVALFYYHDECHYAECRYAEYHHAECRGARSLYIFSPFFFSKNWPRVCTLARESQTLFKYLSAANTAAYFCREHLKPSQ
jgi:hypothetical protein